MQCHHLSIYKLDPQFMFLRKTYTFLFYTVLKRNFYCTSQYKNQDAKRIEKEHCKAWQLLGCNGPEIRKKEIPEQRSMTSNTANGNFWAWTFVMLSNRRNRSTSPEGCYPAVTCPTRTFCGSFTSQWDPDPKLVAQAGPSARLLWRDFMRLSTVCELDVREGLDI